MVDIFEEVDEELRKDKYQDLADKYGPWVLGGALAIIVAAAGFQGFQAWQTSVREDASDQFMVAVNQLADGNAAGAATSFDAVVDNGTRGYADMALLRRAGIALDAGDTASAISLYEQVAAASADPLVSDLAALKAVWAGWAALSFSDIEIRFSPLTDASSPFRHLARESIAAAALEAGDLVRARREYQFLSSSFDAPQGVMRRASEALARIAEHPEAFAGEAMPEADLAAEAISETDLPEPVVDAPAEPETEQPSAGETGDE